MEVFAVFTGSTNKVAWLYVTSFYQEIYPAGIGMVFVALVTHFPPGSTRRSCHGRVLAIVVGNVLVQTLKDTALLTLA